MMSVFVTSQRLARQTPRDLRLSIIPTRQTVNSSTNPEHVFVDKSPRSKPCAATSNHCNLNFSCLFELCSAPLKGLPKKLKHG